MHVGLCTGWLTINFVRNRVFVLSESQKVTQNWSMESKKLTFQKRISIRDVFKFDGLKSIQKYTN